MKIFSITYTKISMEKFLCRDRICLALIPPLVFDPELPSSLSDLPSTLSLRTKCGVEDRPKGRRSIPVLTLPDGSP